MVYEDVDEYLDCLDNIYDKISLAQWSNNHKKVEELMKQVKLPPEQEEKYLILREKNIEINETINFEILSPRYEFLGNMLDMITTDIEVQSQIVSLSDKMLEMFKILYQRINELTDYAPPYY